MENKEINILYLDDEKANLDTFKATFRKDYNIYTALTINEAFDILKNQDIHIAIADQRMPDLSGVQFFEAIMPEYPDTIRMLLTGYADLDSVIEAINTGRIFRYIKKPWDADELKLILDGAAKLFNLAKKNQSLINELQNDVLVQQQMINLLKSYAPESVRDDLSSKGQIIVPMEGEKRIVSVLFIEIINFSTLIQGIDAIQTLKLLNSFFSELSASIEEHKGFLNNFLGGGIIALFGAPVSHINNAANAVSCGLDAVTRIQKFAIQQKLPIKLALGINSGEGVVGSAGSKSKLAYTMYGSVPKIASHLVELGKNYPNQLLISESTYDSAKNLEAEYKTSQAMLDNDKIPIKYYIINANRPSE